MHVVGFTNTSFYSCIYFLMYSLSCIPYCSSNVSLTWYQNHQQYKLWWNKLGGEALFLRTSQLVCLLVFVLRQRIRRLLNHPVHRVKSWVKDPSSDNEFIPGGSNDLVVGKNSWHHHVCFSQVVGLRNLASGPLDLLAVQTMVMQVSRERRFSLWYLLSLICVEYSNVNLPSRSCVGGMCLVLSVFDLLLKRSLRSKVGQIWLRRWIESRTPFRFRRSLFTGQWFGFFVPYQLFHFSFRLRSL